MRAPDPAGFRDAMSRFATGVTVMTTAADDGIPHAMTANAVASVSLDPMLVLVCVERGTIMAEVVARSGVFALSVLSGDQEVLSVHFADPGRPEGEPMLDLVDHHVATTGSLVLDGALAWLDCRVWASYDGGDHLIVVGEVVALGTGGDDDALIYLRSDYRHLPIGDTAS